MIGIAEGGDGSGVVHARHRARHRRPNLIASVANFDREDHGRLRAWGIRAIRPRPRSAICPS